MNALLFSKGNINKMRTAKKLTKCAVCSIEKLNKTKCVKFNSIQTHTHQKKTLHTLFYFYVHVATIY